MTTGASQINTSCRSIAQRCPQIAPSRHGEGGPSSHLINGSSGIPKSTPQMASWFCLAILVQLMAVTDTHTHTDTGIATSAATDCIFALRACDTAWLSMTSTNLPGIGQRYSDDIYAVLLNEATTSQRCSSEARLTYILRLSYHNAEVMIDLWWSSNLQNILRRAQGFSNIQFTCEIIRSS